MQKLANMTEAMLKKSTITLAFVLLLTGCKFHSSVNLQQPTVEIPATYTFLDQEEEGKPLEGQWWEEFGSEELNCVVESALRGNLDLKASWYRVAQACWQARVVSPQKYPNIEVTPTYYQSRSNTPGLSGGISSGGIGGLDPTTSLGSTQNPLTVYLLSTELTYEVDLWQRIQSLSTAACLEYQATREDLQATALLLTATVVDLWFTIQEQFRLLEVIDHQIEVSRTLLELIELRFGVGQSSALDVYQQRLQLAQTVEQRIPVSNALQTAQNQLQNLLGEAPDGTLYAIENGLVDLPKFPDVRSPGTLLCARPELRATYRRINAADNNVAAAVADMFPRLGVSFSYDFQSLSFHTLFNQKISEIIAGLTTPVFDGFRRKSEVNRQRAILLELIQRYGQQYLDALLEVENALGQEKHQLDLIEQINKELEIARINLEESRWHYINGLNDYLSVIAAIQSLQNLERREVTEKKKLLAIRTELYQALGGGF